MYSGCVPIIMPHPHVNVTYMYMYMYMYYSQLTGVLILGIYTYVLVVVAYV